MFQIPEVKRIKRSALLRQRSGDSTSSSRAPSPDGSLPNAQPGNLHEPYYGFEYDFISPDSTQSEVNSNLSQIAHTQDGEEEPSNEQTYEFRLFTTPTRTRAQSPSKDLKHQPPENRPTSRTAAITISFRSPTPPSVIPLSAARFINPHRPQTYYFTSALSESDSKVIQQQYASSTVSADEIVRLATQQRWYGTVLPWRIVKLPSTADLASPKMKKSVPTSIATLCAARSRPSKKRRIHHRQLLAARTAAKQQAVVSEEVGREKRTRRNREKKVKRKERERVKKLEAKGVRECTEGEIGQTAEVSHFNEKESFSSAVQPHNIE